MRDAGTVAVPSARQRTGVLDLMVLGSMIAQIGDLGFTPNRRTRLYRLERGQTTYLPVFALRAATVVVILPLVFAFD